MPADLSSVFKQRYQFAKRIVGINVKVLSALFNKLITCAQGCFIQDWI